MALGSLLGNGATVVAALAAIWWLFARNRSPRLLDALSALALVLALVTRVVDGRWQLVPWEFIAVAVASAAALRRWVPGASRRLIRVPARIGLVFALLLGGLATLTVSVPALPAPSGANLVGSQVFRWTDAARMETFTAEPSDHREVIAQAWYPAQAASSTKVPYFEAQNKLPEPVGSLPTWFYEGFGGVDTHATALPAISAARSTWPVVLLLTGLSEPREAYTSLATELASRGYVVLSLSASYESVTVLGDGRIVGSTVDPFVGNPPMLDLLDVRAADASFALDQLTKLAAIAPGSPLVGHLDLAHVGLVGHSVGGATAINALAKDPRFKVGVNLDGTLFGTLAQSQLAQPFLWVQTGGSPDPNYRAARDGLFNSLRGGGEIVVLPVGTAHNGLTDAPAYFTPTGRTILAGVTNTGSFSVGDMTAMIGGVVAAFVAGPLGRTGDETLVQVLARIPGLRSERHVVAK